MTHFKDERDEIAAAVSRLQSVGAGSTGDAVTARLLRFGVFELDTRSLELRREGRLVHLRLQAVQVLKVLLERSGELVTRGEITDTLWPDDVDVDVEQGLNHCIKEIRVALGDSPETPRYLQTLPRRGYRMLVAVRDVPEPGIDPTERDNQERLMQEALRAAFDAGLRAATAAQESTGEDEDRALTPSRRGFE